MAARCRQIRRQDVARYARPLRDSPRISTGTTLAQDVRATKFREVANVARHTVNDENGGAFSDQTKPTRSHPPAERERNDVDECTRDVLKFFAGIVRRHRGDGRVWRRRPIQFPRREPAKQSDRGCRRGGGRKRATRATRLAGRAAILPQAPKPPSPAEIWNKRLAEARQLVEVESARPNSTSCEQPGAASRRQVELAGPKRPPPWPSWKRTPRGAARRKWLATARSDSRKLSR